MLCIRGSSWGGNNFSDNGNGTVTDNTTGLMWQQDDDNTTRTWKASLSYCEDLTLAGYSNWLLPDIKELESIVDFTKYNPSIDLTYFPTTKSSYYWSYTSGVGVTAWNVPFDTGRILNDGTYHNAKKADSNYVRCMR